MKRVQQLKRVQEQIADIESAMEKLRIPAMYKGAAGEAAETERRRLNSQALDLQAEERRLEMGLTPTEAKRHRAQLAKDFVSQYGAFVRRERMVKMGILKPSAGATGTIIGNRANEAGGMA